MMTVYNQFGVSQYAQCVNTCSVCVLGVYYKQKTAYEMRISDWSSDVCSSDLYEGEEFQEWVAKVGVTPSWLGAAETGPWVKRTQEEIFGLMTELQDKGILKK